MIESSAERTQLFVLLINVALLLTDGTNVEKQSSAKLKQVWGFTGELGGGIKGFPTVQQMDWKHLNSPQLKLFKGFQHQCWKQTTVAHLSSDGGRRTEDWGKSLQKPQKHKGRELWKHRDETLHTEKRREGARRGAVRQTVREPKTGSWLEEERWLRQEVKPGGHNPRQHHQN